MTAREIRAMPRRGKRTPRPAAQPVPPWLTRLIPGYDRRAALRELQSVAKREVNHD